MSARAAWIAAALFLSTLGLAQRWYLAAAGMGPDPVNYNPTDQDLICGVVVEGTPSGAAEPVVVTGFVPSALGCPSSGPIVVWGKDRDDNPVYSVTVAYLWYGPYTYSDPVWGDRALAKRLSDDYLAHFLFDPKASISHWERYGVLTTFPWDDPGLPLPPGFSWEKPPATDDYLELGDPAFLFESNLSGLACFYYTRTFTCWRAIFAYSLPVRLRIRGDEPPASESFTQSFGDPVLEKKTAVAALSLQGEKQPVVRIEPVALPPELEAAIREERRLLERFLRGR